MYGGWIGTVRRAVGDGKGGGRREERGMEGDSTGVGG